MSSATKSRIEFARSVFFILASTFCLLTSVFLSGCSTSQKVSSLNQVIAPLPSTLPRQRPILPTDNESVLSGDLYRYVARTGYNTQYGMPGWTRNNGTRFHEGVDIRPISTVASKYKIRADRADPKTGRVTTRLENVRIPQDKIYAILDGVVAVTSADPSRSGYGKYVIIEHSWSNGTPFTTLYGHLSAIRVRVGQYVSQGTTLGIMGQTARDEASRNYLRANPHMHFEVSRLIDPSSSSFSGKYDPRNLQPYNPIEFLTQYDAISHRVWAAQTLPRAPVLATVMPR